MRMIYLAGIFLLVTGDIKAQPAEHVILISIDGFRPEFFLNKMWPTPNLQQLMKTGVYATHARSVFPSYTYPAHTAMLTGALPARSGIYFNQPKGSKGEWNWFSSVIKVPTLWQIMKKAGLTCGAVEWPVSVDSTIDYNVPEIWDVKHPGDRITAARQYATPGLIDAIERNTTGVLDSVSMDEDYLSLDENSARMAAYIFSTYKPNLLAVHFACVDGAEHEEGRTGNKVSLAVASADRAIGTILEAVQRTRMQDSTTIIIIGDHGFCDIHSVLRPNMLLKDMDVKFTASGGSAFLYANDDLLQPNSVKEVRRRLDSLPKAMRKLFRIIDRNELDKMGADSNALLALSAVPGIVFSNGTGANKGPGTVIQQSNSNEFMSATKGGHHGYDPNLPEMYTGFIAVGAGIKKGGVIDDLCVTDIAPLIAKLLGLQFTAPDGKLPAGVLK